MVKTVHQPKLIEEPDLIIRLKPGTHFYNWALALSADWGCSPHEAVRQALANAYINTRYGQIRRGQ